MGLVSGESKSPILIVSAGETKALQALVSALQATEKYDVTQMHANQLIRKPGVTETTFSAAIFDCNDLNKREFVGVKRTTELIQFAPTLVLATQIALFSFRRISILKNTLTVQKPCDTQVTITLLERMLIAPDIKTPRSPRFITDTPVRLMHLKTGLLVPTRMRNYSASGAFFEYKGLSFKVGDPVEINLEKEDPNSLDETLKMRAKVIWLHEGKSGGSVGSSIMRGIGVQFTSPKTPTL